MIDPFAGSGGFTLGFVEYININNENIDWNFKDNFLNIHHYDMSEDVVPFWLKVWKEQRAFVLNSLIINKK